MLYNTCPHLCGYCFQYPRRQEIPFLHLYTLATFPAWPGIVFDTHTGESISTPLFSFSACLGIENDTQTSGSGQPSRIQLLQQTYIGQLCSQLLQIVLHVNYTTCRWSLCSIYIITHKRFIYPHSLCNLPCIKLRKALKSPSDRILFLQKFFTCHNCSHYTTKIQKNYSSTNISGIVFDTQTDERVVLFL